MLDKKYDHLMVEKDKYDNWKKKGYFKSGDLSKEPYCIVIPPPNVTGKLHLGHAWDTSIQDIIIRYKRMQGFDTLWLPGMDHAGIATQAKVDKKLKSEGINPRSMSREEWLKVAWSWKEEYAENIHSQWAKLGLSLDYDKERFTLDDGLSHAVRKVFVDLYNKGLIYRGERIINWDPAAMTALSNEEVIYKDVEGAFYHIKYMIEGTDEYLEVATTRPETLFGDTAVAVNPDDDRYKKYIGKNVMLPIVNKLIPIIGDEHADMEFGTGVVKITPAHDPNDFEVGNRHNLERIVVMNPNGTMNENAGKYNGMDRFECRDAVIKDLDSEGLLIKIEPINHNVGFSERSDVMVEPYLSKQWFVKMRPLADRVLENQKDKDKKVNFVPPRYEKTMNHWMEITYDWCISRQLWWGHRIPAWYCSDCGEVIVSKTDPDCCPKCGSTNLHQDVDVLDTWFSSGMWPFSTLGWPDKTPELKYYYPTSTLATGYDLIFFWIARMIMFGLYVMGDVPFDTVYIHGMVRDEQGRKMSKSLGNVVNPDDVVKAYGADTMRLYIMFIGDFEKVATWSDDAVKGCKRFLDRVWNLADQLTEEDGVSEKNAPIVHKTIKKVTDDIDTLKMNTAIAALMAMVNEFYANGVSRGDFEALLLMLSPFAPHMVEELWEQKGFAAKYEGKMAMQCAWPEYDESKTVASSVEMAVQVSGKFKGTIIVPVDSDQDTVVEAAKASEKVAKAIAGMQIVKVIHVKNKLVNLIVKPC